MLMVALPMYGKTGTKMVRVYSIVWPGCHWLVGTGGLWSSLHIRSSSASTTCTKTR